MNDVSPAIVEMADQLERQRGNNENAATDDALALVFAEKHRGSLRYVAFWNRWLRFNGIHWDADQTKHAFDLVRGLCREAAAGRGGNSQGS